MIVIIIGIFIVIIIKTIIIIIITTIFARRQPLFGSGPSGRDAPRALARRRRDARSYID